MKYLAVLQDSILDLFVSLQSVEGYRYFLPVGVVGLAILLSALLKIPFFLTIVLGSLPFAIPYLELPEPLAGQHPILLMSVSWLILILVGVGYRVGRSCLRLVSPLQERSSFLSLILMVPLVAATAILFGFSSVEQHQWFGPACMVMFGISILALVISVFRFIRGGVLITVWALATFAFASELFLQGVPISLFPFDLVEKPKFLAESPIGEMVDKVTSEGASGLRVVSLGGRAGNPFPLRKSDSFAVRLEEFLSSSLGTVEILNFEENTARQKLHIGELASLSPDVVVLSASLAEHPAELRGGFLRNLESLPFLDRFAESRIFHVLSYLVEGGSEREQQVHDVESYRLLLKDMFKRVREEGAEPVVFRLPGVSGEVQDLESRDAFYEVVHSEGVLLADVEKAFQLAEHENLFLRGDILSPRGHQLLAKVVSEAVERAVPSRIAYLDPIDIAG